MTTRRWQGDAVAIAQVTTLTPPAAAGEVGIAINGKVLTYPSWNAVAIANKWNLATADLDPVAQSPEFREISAAEDGGSLVLTALTAGKPFIVSTTVAGQSVSNEQQTLTRENSVSGGTFTVTFDGQTTGNIDWDASGATVLAALEALSNIAPGDVTVTETDGGWQVDFAGAYLATDVPEMAVNSSSLTGGISAVNEKQQLSLGAAASTVTFKLKRTDTNASTGDLSTPVSAADVDTALTGLGYDVTCTGGPLIDGATDASPVLTDDGQYGASLFSTSGTTINVRGDTPYKAFIRFTLDIPQGSNVTAAHLALTPLASGSSTVGSILNVYADDSDDPALYASAAAANAATLTSAFGTVTTSSGTSPVSIDITDVIQEIVDRAGFVSGNHVVLHVTMPSSQIGYVYSFYPDEGVGDPPALTATYSASSSAPIVIEWTGADAGTPIPELVVTGTGTLPTISTIQQGAVAVLPLVVPDTPIPGGSTIPVVATQASRGPNHWDDPLNWSGSAVPVNGDAVSIDHSDISILYGLDQSGVTLASLTIGADFTGHIGLPEVNSDGDKYVDYRQQYLKIGSPVVVVGDGAGSGAGLIRLDIVGNTQVDVHQTGSSESAGLTALQIISSGGSNIAANITKGSVGFGLYEGEVATLTTLRVGYRDTPTGDATVMLGPGATCTTLDMSGGTVTAAHAPGTITMTDGDLTIDDGSITTLTQQAGTLKYRGNDTITTAEISGVLDFRQDMRGKTITTLKLYEGFEYHDPHGVVTWTNPAQFIQCSPADGTLDVAKNIELALTLI